MLAAATSGVAIGGAEIQLDGTWNGQWTELPAPKENAVSFELKPASAMIVQLSASPAWP